MKVAIVSDRPGGIGLLSKAIVSRSDLRLCWAVDAGAEALARCREERPDLILMDLGPTGDGGIETTRRIMAETPCPILLVTENLRGSVSGVYEAMSAGALDAVQAPSVDANGMLHGDDELLRKIALLGSLTRAVRGRHRVRAASPLPPIVAVGASTGGPSALSTVLGALPAEFPAAIIVVQHLDVRFTEGLMATLRERTRLKVSAAAGDTAPQPGTIHVAAREDHLILDADGLLRYVREPADAPHRPAIDVLFASLARHPAASGCAVLLTGMGRDGAEGLLALHRAGFLTLAQDEATSVVWGIPGAAVALGAADQVLPLDQLAAVILRRVRSLEPAVAGMEHR